MERLLVLAAACCSIVVAQAAVFKWSAHEGARRWTPAQETLGGVLPLLGMDHMPTSPPKIQDAKGYKRAGGDNTCAYVDGDPEIPLYCGVDSACVYNSVRSNIGCCPDTSTTCSIWTTCLDSSDKNLFTTDNGYTLWCGSSEYPYCRTHVYDDDVFTGYTLLGCAVAAGTDSVVYSPTVSMTSMSSKPPTSGSSGTRTPGLAVTGSGTPGASNTGSSTSSSPPTPTPTPPRPGSSSAPIGAVVGGVVGGVAVMALFALGLVLLLRRRRQHHQGPGNDPYAQTDSPGGNPLHQPPSQTAMQQHFQQPHPRPAPPPAGYAVAAPVMGNRSSIAKPSPVSAAQPIHDPNAAGSPRPPSQSPGTIPPAYQATDASADPAAATQGTSPAIPDAPQQQRPGGRANAGYRGQVQPAHHQPEGQYFEMPTVKSDRELRELA